MGEENDISWALKILDRDPDLEENLIMKYAAPCYGAFTGGGSIVLANHVLVRPLFSGLPVIAAFALGGAIAGIFYKRIINEHYIATEANVRHYITLHPEDFPPPRRLKIADMFEPWRPVR